MSINNALNITKSGRGDITDVSSVPWGQQVLNKVLPW